MRLPKRTTKHVARHQDPVGWTKNGKIKTKDSETGLTSWKGARRGLAMDLRGGDVTSTRINSKDAKVPRSHTVHRGRRGAHTTKDGNE